MHQIPVDTIIVYIKTNTIAIITLKSIKCSIVLGGVLLFFLCFFLFCREDYNGITTFTELLNFTGKICPSNHGQIDLKTVFTPALYGS